MYVQIDIIRLILLKLKVEALIRCQCVCKEWRSTIQDLHFKLSYRGERRVLGAKMSANSLTFTSITNSGFDIETLFQVNRSFLDAFRPLYRLSSGVWCSCNGLVLFSVGKHILLWNPSTHCCTKVLEIRNPLVPGHNIVSGLCYVSSTGYKTVLVFRNRPVIVASLKNKEWRNVPFPYSLDCFPVHHGDVKRSFILSRRAMNSKSFPPLNCKEGKVKLLALAWESLMAVSVYAWLVRL
ncbi:PREDICTED: F-box/kelch-repeat protein At3g23880-like [Ipomoea nil]|uniref:F-box/kelch-repeat protein At3g23880-like n=1 Tax=Ipomoea nil TaxID=35883 RepID=UPI000901FFE9|nr:PREDICTED: F-box/kelch-repeat protein At3g23880-like [Ipomoea nil]